MSTTTSESEKEYMMLREEIIYHMTHRTSIAKFSYTLSVAIFTAAFTVKNPWIVLFALVFLLPIAFRCAEYTYNISYLAAYMKTFLEEDNIFNWETNNHKYAEKLNNHSRSQNKLWTPKMWKVIYYCAKWDFIFLTTVTSFLFWLLRNFNFYIHGHWAYGVIMIGLQVLVVAINIFISVCYTNIPNLTKHISKNWENIKSDSTS